MFRGLVTSTLSDQTQVMKISKDKIELSFLGLGRSRSEPCNGKSDPTPSQVMTPPQTLEEMEEYDSKIFESPTSVSSIVAARADKVKELDYLMAEMPKDPAFKRLNGRLRSSSNENLPSNSFFDTSTSSTPNRDIRKDKESTQMPSLPRQIPSYSRRGNFKSPHNGGAHYIQVSKSCLSYTKTHLR